MAKEIKKKPHTPGVGAELVGTPNEFIDLLLEDGDGKEWMIEQITDEGPEHKQVFSALLLTRMGELVKAVEAKTGEAFFVQDGYEVVNAKDGTILPLPFPAPEAGEEEAGEIIEVISNSPNHELAAFTALLQGIEWSIKSLQGE